MFETGQQKIDESYTEGNIEFWWEHFMFIFETNFIVFVYLCYSSASLGKKNKISYGLWRVKDIGKYIELL